MSRPKPEISKPGIGMSTFMHLQYFHTQILLTILGLLVVVYSSLLKKKKKKQHFPPCLKTRQRLKLSIQHVSLKSYPILYEPPVTEKDVKNP